jgi:DNA-binding PadR family transcriptional regulator
MADGGVSVHDLTGFQRDLLWTILDLQSDPATEQTYGLALKEELERQYENEIFHGRLYPNLDELVEEGLVEKQELDRRTNEYRLTGAGRALLEDVAGRRDRVLDQAANLARADGGRDE